MNRFAYLAGAATLALALGMGQANGATFAYSVMNTINPFVGDLTNTTSATIST